MYKEKRINIKFCCKIGKTATETFQLLKKVYGDNCLCITQVFKWYKRFKEGRENVNDDKYSGRPIEVITEENIQKVRGFDKVCKKSSVRYIEMELSIAKTTIHRILAEKIENQEVGVYCMIMHRHIDQQ